MKTWNELSHSEKRIVFDKELNDTLKAITEAPEMFPELEQEISRAWNIAESNRTPWFFIEILYHESHCKLKIQKIAVRFLHSAVFRTTLDKYVITI